AGQLPPASRCLRRFVRRVRDLPVRCGRLAAPLAELAHHVGPRQVPLSPGFAEGLLKVGVADPVGHRISTGALVPMPEKPGRGTQMVATPITRVSAVNAGRPAAAAISPPGDLPALLAAADRQPDAPLGAADNLRRRQLRVSAELFL